MSCSDPVWLRGRYNPITDWLLLVLVMQWLYGWQGIEIQLLNQ